MTLLPHANTARVFLANKDNPMAQGAWTVSKLLLLLEGSSLPMGFGIAVDATFSRKVFTQQLVTQHGSGLAAHVDTWLQGAWCDSWFMGVCHNTKSITLTMLSWSQMHDMLTPMIPPPTSINP